MAALVIALLAVAWGIYRTLNDDQSTSVQLLDDEELAILGHPQQPEVIVSPPAFGQWFCAPCGSVEWLPVGPNKAVCELCENPVSLISTRTKRLLP